MKQKDMLLLVEETDAYTHSLALRYAQGLKDMAEGKKDLLEAAGEERPELIEMEFGQEELYEGIKNDIKTDDELIDELLWTLAKIACDKVANILETVGYVVTEYAGRYQTEL